MVSHSVTGARVSQAGGPWGGNELALRKMAGIQFSRGLEEREWIAEETGDMVSPRS